ncbi:MAG: hypothetical protein QFX40_04230 [Archaeoglobales archaeon]|nr:hypothetical protein [Archaeoglobales archaeon]
MSVFNVEVGKCSHRTRIEVERKKERLEIKINSTCNNVNSYASRIKDLGLVDVMKPILENPIYVAANRLLDVTCVIPSVLATACWVEAGLISKRLLSQNPNTKIEFEG